VTSPADGQLVRSALLAAADIGPFFRLELHGRELAPAWQPAHQLSRAGLAELTANTARRLGTDETRVAASILHLGLAARLWSPVLGCVLLADVLPDLTSLVVSTEPPIRFGLADPAGWRTGSPAKLTAPAGSPAELRHPGWRGGSPVDRPELAELADLAEVADLADLAEAAAAMVARPLAMFARALPVRLARGLLRGNSASAMAGALGVLARARPDLGASAAALAPALLQTPGLAGAGGLTGSGLAFRRRSCCLYYRVPGGGLCGDCCFDRPPSSRA
jgi:hypothetical protein